MDLLNSQNGNDDKNEDEKISSSKRFYIIAIGVGGLLPGLTVENLGPFSVG